MRRRYQIQLTDRASTTPAMRRHNGAIFGRLRDAVAFVGALYRASERVTVGRWYTAVLGPVVPVRIDGQDRAVVLRVTRSRTVEG